MALRLRGRKSKYGNVTTWVDNIRFSSKREAERYKDLKFLLQTGRIRNLRLQQSYELKVGGVKICSYRADFDYEEWDGKIRDWLRVTEDAKGARTPLYLAKRNLMRAVYGIVIRET